jgi:SAM-dependent methyltransferase
MDLPAHWFERIDNNPDEAFYDAPRLVAHIDPATITALTDFYRQFIPPGASVLDLMSSWISHLPADLQMSRIAGLGMNATELASNPRLTDWCVHNLNTDPQLPYAAQSFDRVLIAVSIQYLIRPVEVLSSVRSTLRAGGGICIAMSHRLFPTKAIAAFQQMPPEDRMRLVMLYLEQAGFAQVAFVDRSPGDADPLWLVTAMVE